ncbi:MAG: xylose isomerase [Bacilli bacterium]|nr:xylose isomerase [Bacilli bacterium]
MEILLQESDPSAFHFLIDLYWVQAGGANPIDCIHQLKGRLEVVHLKDMGVTPDRQQFFAEVGEGNMNWPIC